MFGLRSFKPLNAHPSNYCIREKGAASQLMFRHSYQADNVEPPRSIRFSSKQHSILSLSPIWNEKIDERKKYVGTVARYVAMNVDKFFSSYDTCSMFNVFTSSSTCKQNSRINFAVYTAPPASCSRYGANFCGHIATRQKPTK